MDWWTDGLMDWWTDGLMDWLLQDLNVSCNKVEDLDEVFIVCSLPCLDNLNLGENKVNNKVWIMNIYIKLLPPPYLSPLLFHFPPFIHLTLSIPLPSFYPLTSRYSTSLTLFHFPPGSFFIKLATPWKSMSWIFFKLCTQLAYYEKH